MELIEHRIDLTNGDFTVNKYGKLTLFKDTTKSLLDTAREKRESIKERVEKNT